jgi:hypothetical protein
VQVTEQSKAKAEVTKAKAEVTKARHRFKTSFRKAQQAV